MIAPMSAAAARRPGGVTFVMVLTYIVGLLTLAAGVLIIVVRDRDDVTIDVGETPGSLLTIGIIEVVLGLLILLVAGGLGRGSNGARFLVTFFMVLHIIGALYALFAFDANTRWSAAINALLALLIIVILWSARANAFFGSRY